MLMDDATEPHSWHGHTSRPLTEVLSALHEDGHEDRLRQLECPPCCHIQQFIIHYASQA